jgi:alpha/beta superfamily hydrolase
MTVVNSLPRVARRIDERNGFSEEATFFRSGSQSVFGVLYRPHDTSLGGVVVCPSTDSEFAAYSIDVATARMLASRGVAVQRFHYRGIGHSDGDPQDVSFETMRQDALVATERLVDETGVARVAFLGARLGGLIAASAVAEYRGSPLALIEPTVETARYFRDAWRATLIRDVKAGASTPRSGEGLADALAHTETVDLLGYSMCRLLYESMAGRTLVSELEDHTRRVLLVQLGRSTSVRPDIEAARAELRGRGCHVDLETVVDDVAWWFPPGAELERPRRRGLVNLTSTWLTRELEAVPA